MRQRAAYHEGCRENKSKIEQLRSKLPRVL